MVYKWGGKRSVRMCYQCIHARRTLQLAGAEGFFGSYALFAPVFSPSRRGQMHCTPPLTLAWHLTAALCVPRGHGTPGPARGCARGRHNTHAVRDITRDPLQTGAHTKNARRRTLFRPHQVCIGLVASGGDRLLWPFPRLALGATRKDYNTTTTADVGCRCTVLRVRCLVVTRSCATAPVPPHLNVFGATALFEVIIRKSLAADTALAHWRGGATRQQQQQQP
jgi:hypothetical protein